MRLLIALLTVSLLLIAIGCNTKQVPPSPSPTPTPRPSPSPEEPKERAAKREAVEQNLADQNLADQNFPEISRSPVRDAATQFVKTELPTWTLKGISTEAYESNTFWADVDIESGKRNRILSLIVKRFYPDNGDPYWKAFPVSDSRASRIHAAHDAEIKRQLNDTTNELEEYKSEHP